MRVTSNLMADTVSSSFFKNAEQLLKIQSSIATGKRINKPSDDPVGMGRVLNYRKTLSSIDQYQKNIGSAKSWLNLTDSALGSVDSLLIRAKEVAVYQATGTANDDTRTMAAEEVKNILDDLLQMANTKLGSSYIFAGFETDSAPFSRDEDYIVSYNGASEVTEITCAAGSTLSGGESFGLSTPSTDYYVWYRVDGSGEDPAVEEATGIAVDITNADDASAVAVLTASRIESVAGLGASSIADKVTVTNAASGSVSDAADNDTGFVISTATQGDNGDDGEIRIITGDDVDINVNASGVDAFNGDVRVFDVLRDLKVALEDNDVSGISGQIDLIDDALDQVLKVRSEVGAKVNRLETTESYWENFRFNIEDMLSGTEDADISRAITELTVQEAAYEASLAVAGRIIQPSLINFLK